MPRPERQVAHERRDVHTQEHEDCVNRCQRCQLLDGHHEGEHREYGQCRADQQRDAGDELDEVDVAQAEPGVLDGALGTHHSGHLIGLELLLRLATGSGTRLVGQVVALDGAVFLVGTALEVLERLVVGGRLGDGRGVYQGVPGVQDKLLAGLLVVVGRVVDAVDDQVLTGSLVLLAEAGGKARVAVVVAVQLGVEAALVVAGGELLALEHVQQVGVANLQRVDARDLAVGLTALLTKLAEDAAVEGVNLVLQTAAVATANVDGADEAHGGARDLGHVIALSVSGLSTERIERTARGKQTLCLSGAVR